MTKTNQKTKYLFLFALLTLIAISISGIAFAVPFTVTDAYRGNYDLSIVLDVNGQTEHTASVDISSFNDVTANNTFRSRLISGLVLSNIAADTPFGNTIVYNVEPGTVTNRDTAFIHSVAHEGNGIRITAGERTAADARVTVNMQGFSRPLVIRVIVRATFAPAEYLYNTSRTLALTLGHMDGGQPRPYTIRLTNNSQEPRLIMLPDLLTGTATATNHRTFLHNTAVAGVAPNFVPFTETDGITNWQLRDISSAMTIAQPSSTSPHINVQFAGGTIPAIALEANVPQYRVDPDYFTNWRGTNTHQVNPDVPILNTPLVLHIPFSAPGGRTIQIAINVIIEPNNSPVLRRDFSIPTALNLDAPEGQPAFNNNAIEHRYTNAPVLVRGFASVLVTPEDLLCHAQPYRPSQQQLNMEFMSVTYVGGAAGDVLRNSNPGWLPRDGQDRSYIRIDAVGRGQQTLSFRVRYRFFDSILGDVQREIDVSVTFTVVGGFDAIYIAALGRRTVPFNLTTLDDVAELNAAGFRFNRIMWDQSDVTNEAIFVIDHASNMLIVRPDLSNSENRVERLRIQAVGPGRNNHVYLWVNVRLDINAGSWFRELPLHSQVLFIVGMSLLGVIVILLIIFLILHLRKKAKKKAEDENGPASSYLIRLNSTIMAQQQQRATAAGAYMGPVQTLQLGAGLSQQPSPPPPQQQVNPLQLGAGHVDSSDASVYPNNMPPPPTEGFGELNITQTIQQEEIYIPLSDEQLLEKIFVEKYEPRGMTRRSFFKSKDLQNRELQKEKERIREAVRNGTTIEEACGIAICSAPTNDMDDVSAADEKPSALCILLGFNPDKPVHSEVASQPVGSKIIVDENGHEKMVFEEISEEEATLLEVKREYEKLCKEHEELLDRIGKISSALEKDRFEINECDSSIKQIDGEIASFQSALTDLEVKMASCRGKKKDECAREIADVQERMRQAQSYLCDQQKMLDEKTLLEGQLCEALASHEQIDADKVVKIDECYKRLETCQKAYDDYLRRMQEAKKRKEFERRKTWLTPPMKEVYYLNRDVARYATDIEDYNTEITALKADIAALKTQMLSTTDPVAIANISAEINEKNSLIANTDALITDNTKQKAAKTIELSTVRRKCNDFVAKEDMCLADVIAIEDDVIRHIVFDEYKNEVQINKDSSEKTMEECQNRKNDLMNSMDERTTQAAMELAAEVQRVSDEMAQAQSDLAMARDGFDNLNLRMETATEDEALELISDQANLAEQIEQYEKLVESLANQLEQAKADGLKANLALQEELEESLKAVTEETEGCKTDFEKFCEVFVQLETVDDIGIIADPMFDSGGGVISQDAKIIEESSLKKQLAAEQEKAEYARLAAEIAKAEADQAKEDSVRLTREAQEEAERREEEAVERAKAAEEEVERMKAEAAERAKTAEEEAERIKAEAAEHAKIAEEEAAERAKTAEEEAERIKAEAAERAKAAEEEVERIKAEAMAEAEKARTDALAELEKAKADAAEEIEKARIAAAEEAARAAEEARKAAEAASDEIAKAKADAEAELKKALAELEQAKALATTDVERSRIEAEQAKLLADDEARKRAMMTEEERKEYDRISGKLKQRKEEIMELRKGIKDITNGKQGEDLKEKFYGLKMKLDEDEQKSAELMELIERGMSDSVTAGKMADLEARANAQPKYKVKKVTERVNKIQRPPPGGKKGPPKKRTVHNVKNVYGGYGYYPDGRPKPPPPGARPRPGARPGARPAGARPAGARPGARPGAARPAGARPYGAKPAPRPGARPGAPRPGAPGKRPPPRPGGGPPKRPPPR